MSQRRACTPPLEELPLNCAHEWLDEDGCAWILHPSFQMSTAAEGWLAGSAFSVRFAFLSIFRCLEDEYIDHSNAVFGRDVGFSRVNSSGDFCRRHENTDTACMDSSVIMPQAGKESIRKQRKTQVRPVLYSNQAHPFNFQPSQSLTLTKMN